jgi:hypothetical protein
MIWLCLGLAGVILCIYGIVLRQIGLYRGSGGTLIRGTVSLLLGWAVAFYGFFLVLSRFY